MCERALIPVALGRYRRTQFSEIRHGCLFVSADALAPSLFGSRDFVFGALFASEQSVVRSLHTNHSNQRMGNCERLAVRANAVGIVVGAHQLARVLWPCRPAVLPMDVGPRDAAGVLDAQQSQVVPHAS